MKKVLIYFSTIVICTIVFIFGTIRYTFYANEIETMTKKFQPTELDLYGIGLDYFKDEEMITSLHYNIKNKKAIRINNGEIKNRENLIHFDYGYKAKTLYFNQYGEIYFYMRKSDIGVTNRLYWLLWRVDGLFSKSNYTEYKTDPDKELMFILGNIVNKNIKNKILYADSVLKDYIKALEKADRSEDLKIIYIKLKILEEIEKFSSNPFTYDEALKKYEEFNKIELPEIMR